jgi:hypothetical protein
MQGLLCETQELSKLKFNMSFLKKRNLKLLPSGGKKGIT